MGTLYNLSTIMCLTERVWFSCDNLTLRQDTCTKSWCLYHSSCSADSPSSTSLVAPWLGVTGASPGMELLLDPASSPVSSSCSSPNGAKVNGLKPDMGSPMIPTLGWRIRPSFSSSCGISFSDKGRALVRSRNHGLASCEVGNRDTSTGERWL